MTTQFSFSPAGSETELRLRHGDQDIPFDRWAIEAPNHLLPGVELATALLSADQALADNASVLLSDEATANLSARQAKLLGMPDLADVVARITTTGIVTTDGFRTTLQWLRSTGQPVLGAQRMGAWLRIGGKYQRLSSALLAIAKAVEAAGAATDLPSRLTAVARLRETLPAAQETGAVSASGLPALIDIVQADSFSLDLRGDGARAMLVPILHRAGQSEPLLSAAQQDEFGTRQFNAFAEARPVYTLPGQVFVVLTPVLRRALTEIRRHQSSPVSVKRALLASPRAYLQAALEAEDDPTLLEQVETVFQETPAYSDRVIGMGLWEPRDLPWVARVPMDWLGHAADTRPEALPGLDRQEAARLAGLVATAIEQGHPSVNVAPPGETPHEIPATAAMLEALKSRAAEKRIERDPAPAQEAPQVAEYLTNEKEVEHQQDFTQRAALPLGPPASLLTPLKEHQVTGLRWLQESWCAGAPGVLLADDMGLGKTLQGLAFLAWLREAMQRQDIARGPMLIVAPTGLLANWSEEHARHLSDPGLGECMAAFGARLRDLRLPGVPDLDKRRLQSAAWILTTYETLRDHAKDFAAIHFAAVLADEAQKVKTPATRMTDAFKAVNADFRIAMTGTPVENRLADLWCIVDGIRSGCLGALAEFSRKYEANPEPDHLRGLKQMLDEPFGGAPPLLLRRMKEDHLPDLPRAVIHLHEAPMPPVQRQAYDTALAGARALDGLTGVLQAIHRFRAISLHPTPDMEGGDDAFIAASARLMVCFAALDKVAAAGERALIFLDSRQLQPRIAGLIQRRYRLAATPEIINGAVSGAQRQQRVNRFQQAPEGFDALVLSPRAAGVGLTITRANHVFHLERWWNPAVEDQCTSRALRIGQTKPVHVHIPLATGREVMWLRPTSPCIARAETWPYQTGSVASRNGFAGRGGFAEPDHQRMTPFADPRKCDVTKACGRQSDGRLDVSDEPDRSQ